MRCWWSIHSIYALLSGDFVSPFNELEIKEQKSTGVYYLIVFLFEQSFSREQLHDVWNYLTPYIMYNSMDLSSRERFACEGTTP